MSEIELIASRMNEILLLDEQIKTINNKLKEIKKSRENKECSLLEIIKKNKLSDKKFKINNKSVFLFNNSILPPINISLLETILVKYIDKSNVDFLINKIEEHRNHNRKTSLILKRKTVKDKLSRKNKQI